MHIEQLDLDADLREQEDAPSRSAGVTLLMIGAFSGATVVILLGVLAVIGANAVSTLTGILA